MSIADTFNKHVRSLLVRIERKLHTDIDVANLYRLKKRINILKSALGEEEPLKQATPFFIKYSDEILRDDAAARDAFFLNANARDECAKMAVSIDKTDEFIFDLIETVKSHYKSVSREERVAIYEDVRQLLICCLEYETNYC
jgi:hypothetical protein